MVTNDPAFLPNCQFDRPGPYALSGLLDFLIGTLKINFTLYNH
jgi:hypothetical protein